MVLKSIFKMYKITQRRKWSIMRSKRLRAEMDPANRECLTSQAVRGIWIVGCGCFPGKRYQRIRTCLTGEVETSSSPIRHQAPDVNDRTEFRMWDIRRRWNVGGQNSRCEISKKMERRRTEFRMWDIRRRWNVGGQNSRCEISGESGTSADIIPDVRYPEKVKRWPDRILLIPRVPEIVA